MTQVRVSEDIVPVSAFKTRAAEWLDRVMRTGRPVIITQNGRPAGVLLSPAAFDALSESAGFLSAVEQGLDDADHGRVLDHAEIKDRARRTFGPARRT